MIRRRCRLIVVVDERTPIYGLYGFDLPKSLLSYVQSVESSQSLARRAFRGAGSVLRRRKSFLPPPCFLFRAELSRLAGGFVVHPGARRSKEATMAQTFTGRKRVRKFFGKIEEVAEMPNLIEVQ